MWLEINGEISKMLAKVKTAAVVGLDAQEVQVEVDIMGGLPAMNIVGLPDTAVQEARERVRSAVRNSGGFFPMRRITVNLAPADLKKAGPAYDLPIAVGVIMSSEQVAVDASDMLFLGELSLDGSLRHTQGIISMVGLAKEKGISTVFVPAADAREASLIEGITVIPVSSLTQLIAHLRGAAPISSYVSDGIVAEAIEESSALTNLALIKGQEHVKRALEVAAAG